MDPAEAAVHLFLLAVVDVGCLGKVVLLRAVGPDKVGQ